MPPVSINKRKKWNNMHMKSAILAIKNKEMGFLKAQKTFNVPRGTLFRFIKYLKEHPSANIDEVVGVSLGRKPVFSREIEKEFVNHCLDMDNRYFGLSMKDLRRLAFQFAQIQGIKNPFNSNDMCAGRKWFKNFLRRNSELSMRSAQGTSVARIKGFNKKSVEDFFSILEAEYEKHNYPANRIFNCDETGLTIVQSKIPKVLARKGKKQIGSLTSAERGSLVTVVTCMSASGIYVPLLLIFPRKNMKNELKDGAPPGTVFETHPSGWIQGDIFTKWFKHFISYVKPSETERVMLILDGHYSHTRNLDLILAARQSYVTIVCLPPHCSHKMQPLDIAFMHPLKAYYNDEVRTWLNQHRDPVRPITHYQISKLLGKAYSRAATIETAVNGFRKAGIFPLDKNIFKDIDFIEATNEEDPFNIEVENVSVMTYSSEIVHVATRPAQMILQNISPIPKLPEKPKNPRGRKPGSAKVLTSTPNKEDLESSKKVQPSTSGIQSVKRKVFTKSKKAPNPSSSDEDSSENDEPSYTASTSDISSDDNEDDAECFVCGILWSLSVTSQGEWIKCNKCGKWAHDKCVGSPDTVFTCNRCKKLKKKN